MIPVVPDYITAKLAAYAKLWSMLGLVNTVIDVTVVCHVDAVGRAYLGKQGPKGIVCETLDIEYIKATAPGVTQVAPYKVLEAGDELSSRENANRFQQIREGNAVDGDLVYCLVEQDVTRECCPV